MGVRPRLGAASQARFVYARAESDFIGAAAPPRARPAPPLLSPHTAGTHPSPLPPPAALLPLPPVSQAGLGRGRARRAPARTAACCASLCRGAAGRGLRARAAVRLGRRLSRPESQALRVCSWSVCPGGKRLCARARARAHSCVCVWISGVSPCDRTAPSASPSFFC